MAKHAADWRDRVNLTTVAALMALGLALINSFGGYLYVNDRLNVNVTEISYGTDGSLYLTVGFMNAGNREAALLRSETVLWFQRENQGPEWVPMIEKVRPDVPLTEPKPPLIIRSGGVELVTMSTVIGRAEAERAQASPQGGAFLGIRITTMNSDGHLYLIEHPVARLLIDSQGRIVRGEPMINRTLSGLADLMVMPPIDMRQANKQTPFVWQDVNR